MSESRPWFKRWWVWILATVVVIGMGNAISSGGTGSAEDTPEAVASSASEPRTSPTGPSADRADVSADVVGVLPADLASLVMGATREGSSLWVATSIVDPREAGSAAAAQAVAICSALAESMSNVDAITVNESDGTGLAIMRPTEMAGHPAGECFEY